MAARAIVFINPSPDQMVSAAIDASLAPFRFNDGPRFEVVSLRGPDEIASAAAVDDAAPLVRGAVAGRPGADAFVIAHPLEPGLAASQEVARVPVLGLLDAALLTAAMRMDRIGCLIASAASLDRALAGRALVGATPVVCESLNLTGRAAIAGKAYPAVSEAAKTLLDRGASGIVCLAAGFAEHAASLRHELAVPVVDAIEAAAGLALGIAVTGPCARSSASL